MIGKAANLGHNLYFLGDLVQAEAILTRYAELSARELSADHAHTHFIRSYLAKVWIEQGKADRAVETLNEVLTARRKNYPKGDWRTASSLAELGRAKLALGKPDEAASVLEESRKLYSSFPPPNDYYAPWADACHGMAYLASGKNSDADCYCWVPRSGSVSSPRARNATTDKPSSNSPLCTRGGRSRSRPRSGGSDWQNSREDWNKPGEAAKWRQTSHGGIAI